MWEDAHYAAEPPDDEDLIVEIPGNLLTVTSHFSSSLATLDPRLTVQVDAPAAKRPGEPLDAGYNKEERTAKDKDEPDLDVDLEDFGIAQEGGNPGRQTAQDKDASDLGEDLRDFGLFRGAMILFVSLQRLMVWIPTSV